MRNGMKRGMIALSVAFALMVSLSSFASALGMSLGPSRNNPLLLAPGESTSISVNLQNVAGEQDVAVRLSVTQGNEIANTEDVVYNLNAGSANNYANVLVNVPMTAIIGTEYTVTLSLVTVNNADGGQGIAFGSAMEVSFPVRVIEKPAAGQLAPSRENLIALLAVVAALIVILWIVLKRYGKKGKKK